MIVRTTGLLVLLAAPSGRPLPSAAAFQIRPAGFAGYGAARSAERPPSPCRRGATTRPEGAIAAAPRMSSIPDDGDGEDPPTLLNPFDLEGIKGRLPPAPEDRIALLGDVLALFVYSYLDHAAIEMFGDTGAKMDVGDLVTGDPGGAAALPVWFDPAHLRAFGESWLAPGCALCPYAPAIAASGLAFVAIATSWIASGYVSGAFLHRNTLECSAERAVVVALRTWMGTALLMVLLAWGSDALWGQLDAHFNALSAPARGGLTKADADFIFDSLSVLAFWRLVLNWMLGYR